MKKYLKRKRDNDIMNPVNHVAIIMDGNGRWALNRRKSRNYGHQQGLKTIEKIVDYSIKKKFLI